MTFSLENLETISSSILLILQYYFLGFIFLSIITKVTNLSFKQENTNLLSVMISFVVISIVSCFPIIKLSIKIILGLIISIGVSLLLGFLYNTFRNSKFIVNIVKCTNKPIWEDILDYEKGNIFKIRMKNESIEYLGHIRLISDDNKWIGLNNYKILKNINENVCSSDSSKTDNPSIVMISVDSIQSIEVFYDPNSKNPYIC